MKHLLSTFALAACCVSLTNCGGGGGGGRDESPPTVRPKTLDGVVLTLGGNVRFELVRNIGSAPAISNGDVETGDFFYTLGGNQLRTYPNTNGDNSDVRYPDSITNASYSYRAINDTAGILTLTGFGVNDLVTSGGFAANNGSFVYLFNNDSNGIENRNVVVDLTFSQNGATVSVNSATVRQPGGDPLFDNVIIPTNVSLATGGQVPTNYNPVVSPLRESRIVPETLDQRLIRFTNGIPDPTLDFTIQFTSDSGVIAGLPPPGSLTRLARVCCVLTEPLWTML